MGLHGLDTEDVMLCYQIDWMVTDVVLRSELFTPHRLHPLSCLTGFMTKAAKHPKQITSKGGSDCFNTLRGFSTRSDLAFHPGARERSENEVNYRV